MTQLNEKISENHSRASASIPAREANILIWDLPVRIFHWSIVILFVAAYITNSMGAEYFKYHVWTGYGMIVLVAFRILWGVVGTYHARFVNFVRDPLSTAKYAFSFFKTKDDHHIGHNPLGAIMVVILLLALLTQAITGLFTNDEIFNVGPLYGYITSELSLSLTSLHRQLFYWISGAVVLHILAVLFHVFVKRENIVKTMITGKKFTNNLSQTSSIRSSRIWLAAIIVIALSLILAWVIQTAPEAVTDLY